jgi:hypothetical protein
MGYTTEFEGSVNISPPLNAHEIAYLRKFARSWRMDREFGPYFVDGSGFKGQGDDPDIRNGGPPPPEQPGFWCEWEPTEDGTAIKWNGGEKFYDSVEWMTYLIDTFLKPGAALASELASPVPGRHYPGELRHFTFDHELNGILNAQGEEEEDQWQLAVTGNAVTTVRPGTESEGSADISPPLNAHEIAYLRKFAQSRHMNRELGPYFVDGSGESGQGHDADIRNYNMPGPGQPGSVWCEWEPTEDGTAIKSNGQENTCYPMWWMTYLIDTFLKPGAALASELASPVPGRHYPEEFRHFTFDHELNGVIEWAFRGYSGRRFVVTRLVVTGNAVTVWPDEVDLPGMYNRGY